jgi:hypothetical protein
MKKPSTPSLVLIALVLGLFAGFQCGMWTHRHFSAPIERDLRMRGQEDRADIALRALNLLRAGSTNAAPFLENQLDDAIVSLGRVLTESPASERGQSDLLMLGKARDYRAKFPHKSGQPGVDEGIAQAFAILDEKH